MRDFLKRSRKIQIFIEAYVFLKLKINQSGTGFLFKFINSRRGFEKTFYCKKGFLFYYFYNKISLFTLYS